MRKFAKVIGSQMPTEARMQNESYPRRNMASQPIRRGSQRAGRNARAKREMARYPSFRANLIVKADFEKLNCFNAAACSALNVAGQCKTGIAFTG
ncbi:hypothetical protein RU07_12260 [Agrobacterium tumefaciens]|uniref:Uncharacterized protein n=1 Tax=Agrobacterium tumefaciens TaxID=358 RepID=A0A0D0K1R0_AGRTU|nr:hypothetical protein RU07_12260 [Agrobacterium tumefaciens]